MNIRVRMVGKVLLCVHNQHAPTDAEWEVFLGVWREHLEEVTGQLVFSSGGGPNPKQRAESVALIQSRSAGAPPTAVITESTIARGIVTALSWIVRGRIRAFDLRAVDDACRFIAAPDQAALVAALAEARGELGVATSPPPAARPRQRERE